MTRTGLPALLALLAVAAVALLAAPATGSAAPVRQAAQPWPVPIPEWFWPWARWYLGRAEFANEPFRSEETRPGAAPRAIPAWGWRRLEALLTPGIDEAQPPPAQRTVRTWPVPLPQWFWVWARWYLGRAEFADDGPQAQDVRPRAAPRYIPAWAWQRLQVLQGGEPTPQPAEALERGDDGPAVEALQRALNGARYVAGPADGVFGAKTRYGVIAFQQANGLEPDGVVSPEQWLEIMRERRPAPPLASPDDYVYVDLDRQVLFDVQGGDVRRILPVSTGGGYAYTGLDGRRHTAVTPTGRFEVFRKVAGKDRSYLGTLYYPSYFTNGYAIHGSQSVPAEPVSHGCVRIPLYLAQEFFARMRIGTPVIVD